MVHDFFMYEAVKEAHKAAEKGEVPVGAVIVAGGRIISRGCNMTEELHDATAHAEMIAIREACRVQDNWRLKGCSIYVTLEPCPMCAGAILLSRIGRLVIGAQDPQRGCCGSIYDIVEDSRLGFTPEVITGVLEDECRKMLKDFFKEKR